MQTIDASTILDDAYHLMAIDQSNLEPLQKFAGRMAFSQALQEVWERWWWEDLLVSTRMQFATNYQGITGVAPFGWAYPTGMAVYFPPSDAYFIALWPAGPPALQIGESYQTYQYNDGLPDYTIPVTVLTENPYGWAKYNPCATTATPAPWTKTLNPNLGDRCTFQGNVFQWIVNAGALPNNQPDPALVWPAANTNPGWMLYKPFFPTVPYDKQLPNLASPYNFTSSITGYFGTLLSVTQQDPRITANTGAYQTRVSDDASGVVVLGLNQTYAWLTSRRPTPVITGDDFDAAVAYAATPAPDLVFDS